MQKNAVSATLIPLMHVCPRSCAGTQALLECKNSECSGVAYFHAAYARTRWLRSPHGESQHAVARAAHPGAPSTAPTCSVPGTAYSRTGGRQYCWCRDCGIPTAGTPDPSVPPLTDSKAEDAGARGLSDARLCVRALPICGTHAGSFDDIVAYVHTAHTVFNANPALIAMQQF